ncbi:MAG: GNAT family N-acetyltransferase [Candidatus Omnitrophica bacterium]|nr:GNAT family N-acetyltransferase [Candidatus Omnitrophota bacterium]
MSSIEIRRADRSDFPAVTKLWLEMMEYHLSLDPRFELSFDSEQAYAEYLDSIFDNYDYAVFVAQIHGEIVGYTIAMILSNPAVFSLSRYGFIAEMMVTKEHQRSGVGSHLWNFVRRWFHRRGVSVIQLNVSPNNERGCQFWKRVGCSEFLHILWHTIPKDL